MEKSITSANDRTAAELRKQFTEKKIFCVNLISAPGSGKTALIEKTVAGLCPGMPVAVIEGDPHTELDSLRVRETGARAVQINTQGGCHLDAAMIRQALASLEFDQAGLMIIENVGNLLCPAPWDLGEHLRVVVASLPEGADKPLKYPETFLAAQVLIINKIDLESALKTKVADIRDAAFKVNPRLKVFALSCDTGEGVSDWCTWLRAQQKEMG